MGENWDRRQVAEDRWRAALDEHLRDPLAHSAERHQFVNTILAPQQLAQELRFQKLEGQMQAAALERAGIAGEARANRRTLRLGFSAIGLLITVFGAAILHSLGVL